MIKHSVEDVKEIHMIVYRILILYMSITTLTKISAINVIALLIIMVTDNYLLVKFPEELPYVGIVKISQSFPLKIVY